MDPNLVRGKKCKREEDEQVMKSDKISDHEDEEAMEDEKIESKSPHTSDPEGLLKYRAGLLNYQGNWLHYQASIMEERAKKARAEAAYVPTICYSIKHSSYPQNSPDPYSQSPGSNEHSPYHESYGIDQPFYREESNHSYEEEAPLDLSLKKDVVAPLASHHTQSQQMPRIFFSVGSK